MLIYIGKKSNVKDAIAIANKILSGHRGFYASVRAFNYELTNTTSRNIADAILKIHLKYNVKVKVKYHWNPFSKMIAVFNPNKPLEITLNKWKIKRDKYSIVNTLCHEFVHVVDNQYFHLDFGHASNSRYGKEKTAPYAIGRISENLAKAYF